MCIDSQKRAWNESYTGGDFNASNKAKVKNWSKNQKQKNSLKIGSEMAKIYLKWPLLVHFRYQNYL